MTTVALTLADMINESTPLVAGVMQTIREESPIMNVLPFADMAALSIKSYREGSMPNVSWRRIGADHGSVKGSKPSEVTENAFSVGNEVDLDIAYMMDKSPRLYDPLAYQTRLITKSIARGFSDKLINGVPGDEDNPTGLWYRVVNDLAAAQNIDASAASNNGGLDISPDATTFAANIQTFIDRLDQLLYAVTDSMDGGQGVYVLGNDTSMFRLNSALRQSGLLSDTTDSLGRVFKSYKGATFLDMGLKYDESTRIIGNVELAAGTALTGGGSTSLYAVKIGKEYLTGWQEYGMKVSDYELQANKVTYKQVIDWVVGIAITHPRSVARLYGVVAA